MKTFQQFSEEVNPLRNPVQWWNQGRNTNVPNENKASWRDLAKDDWSQRQRTKGAGKGSWNPVRGMPGYGKLTKGKAVPGGFQTGPTPAVRQAFERPVRFAGKVLQTIGRGARAVGAVGSALKDGS